MPAGIPSGAAEALLLVTAGALVALEHALAARMNPPPPPWDTPVEEAAALAAKDELHAFDELLRRQKKDK